MKGRFIMNKYRKINFLDAVITAVIIAVVIMAIATFVYVVAIGIESININRVMKTYEAIEGGVY